MSQTVHDPDAAQLSERDVLTLHHLVAEVSYAFDSGEYAQRFPAVLTEDVVYENPGVLRLEGRDALVATLEGMTGRALSHHTSTVTVTATGPDTATCRSKVITFRSGGRFSVGEFHDTVRRDPSGSWKLAQRLVRPIV
ncbi:nuclear transport factor 2 family protein [Pseudonocardia broussonetiae]|uniref:Nuclear transport factor 2 family protein n=1 Tax=Pseudonocardia broussonetiae TaxID=2736640 RepID=A0A6M6JR57_9PSEU|nr:nuclear transport factor 2 family protein [Pseudonocardia broussonetiae]QJY48869.1 nuclear transport factor 2 family protein [Pseudonocardia broussonetiae]